MSETLFRTIVTRFYECAPLHSHQGAQDVVDIVRALGGEILSADRQLPEQDIFAHVSPGVDIISLSIEHSLLEGDSLTSATRAIGSADFRLSIPARFITISQDVTDFISEQVTAVALGQMAFAILIWPYLKPSYGLIDERNEKIPSEHDVKLWRIKSVFWANFFGKAYIDKLGKDFLLQAPSWKTEMLSEEGIVHVTSADFMNRSQEISSKTLQVYFRQAFPQITIYKPR